MTTPLERQLLSAKLRHLVRSVFEGTPASPEFTEVVTAIADGDERAAPIFETFIESARLWDDPKTRTGHGAVARQYVEKFLDGSTDVVGFDVNRPGCGFSLPIVPIVTLTSSAACRVSTKYDDEHSDVLSISLDITWDAHSALRRYQEEATDLPPVVASLLEVVLDSLNVAWQDDVRAEFGPDTVVGDYPDNSQMPV